jgi:hypothetical protein
VLCAFDFTRMGLSGLDAASALLAMQAGLPIVIAAREQARGRADKAESKTRPAKSKVRRIERRAQSMAEFRATVQHLRRTGAPMHLELEI